LLKPPVISGFLCCKSGKALFPGSGENASKQAFTGIEIRPALD
jgi:hypothetical protein